MLVPVLAALALLTPAVLSSAATGPAGGAGPAMAPPTLATRVLGSTRSGLPWHSGAWQGGNFSGPAAEAWGTWRGRPSDLVTTYPDTSTGWEGIKNSRWSITTFAGFSGRLLYGLPLAPAGAQNPLPQVAAGQYDDVWAQVADDLVAQGRADAIVRVGWEANGSWFSWNTTTESAPVYRAAFRRVAEILKARGPDLLIDFDVACGTPLSGQTDRREALTALYPGDDVVDLIGCDTYDWDDVKVTDERTWQNHLRPRRGAGLADVADFARSRGKGMTVPEWGVSGRSGGGGDNPLFIRKMRDFFVANRDVLVAEAYFSEIDSAVKSDLIQGQNPAAAQAYRELWQPAGASEPQSANAAEGANHAGWSRPPEVAR